MICSFYCCDSLCSVLLFCQDSASRRLLIQRFGPVQKRTPSLGNKYYFAKVWEVIYGCCFLVDSVACCLLISFIVIVFVFVIVIDIVIDIVIVIVIAIAIVIDIVIVIVIAIVIDVVISYILQLLIISPYVILHHTTLPYTSQHHTTLICLIFYNKMDST